MMEFEVKTEGCRFETLFADRFNRDEYGLHFYCREKKVAQFTEEAEIIGAEKAELDGPLRPRGELQFNELADVSFKNLTEEVLERSDSIDVQDGVIYEVVNE